MYCVTHFVHGGERYAHTLMVDRKVCNSVKIETIFKSGFKQIPYLKTNRQKTPFMNDI